MHFCIAKFSPVAALCIGIKDVSECSLLTSAHEPPPFSICTCLFLLYPLYPPQKKMRGRRMQTIKESSFPDISVHAWIFTSLNTRINSCITSNFKESKTSIKGLHINTWAASDPNQAEQRRKRKESEDVWRHTEALHTTHLALLPMIPRK